MNQTFLADVVWMDEAYFSQNSMHNMQHTHYWVLENPKLFSDVRHEVRFGINIWCSIYNNKQMRPMFYNGILAGARYIQLLQNVMLNF